MTDNQLSVGFATRDDFHGAWMTIETLLEFHGHVVDQIVIVDNSPQGSKHADTLATFVKGNKRIKYIRAIGESSSCVYKGQVFTESDCRYAACCDSHVIFGQGALDALMKFWQSRPEDSRDIASGPCLSSSGRKAQGTNQMIYESEPYPVPDGCQVHEGSIWRGGNMGAWVYDKRVDGEEPFEIMQQGTGFFSMRREAWVGFDQGFMGHGGNETYLFEKVRQMGGAAYCIPQARWIHRFPRPDGVPYKVKWNDKVENYIGGFMRLPTPRPDLARAAEAHFKTVCPQVLAAVKEKLKQPVVRKSQVSTRTKAQQSRDAVKRTIDDWYKAGNKIDGGSVPRALLKELTTLIKPEMRTLELGSGVSSLLFDQLSKDHTAVEHNEKWVAKVAPLLGRAALVHAPLSADQRHYKVELDGPYQLVLIDGPPNVKGGDLRDGCLELLKDELSRDAIIVVDDTHRAGERRLVERLCRLFGKTARRVVDGVRSFDVLEPVNPIATAAELPCVHRSASGPTVTCCPRENGGFDRTVLHECALLKRQCVVDGSAVSADGARALVCATCAHRESGNG